MHASDGHILTDCVSYLIFRIRPLGQNSSWLCPSSTLTLLLLFQQYLNSGSVDFFLGILFVSLLNTFTV